jgi:hypothetical protein
MLLGIECNDSPEARITKQGMGSLTRLCNRLFAGQQRPVREKQLEIPKSMTSGGVF